MTPEQQHIIKKMETIHKVKIWGMGERKALIVLSHNEKKNEFLSYRIGYRGNADLLSVIKGSNEAISLFKNMKTRREWK